MVHRRGSWVLGPWVRTGLLVLLAALVVALLIRPKTSTETPDLSGLAGKVNAAMTAQTGVTHSSAGYLPRTGTVLVSNLTGVSTSQLNATLAAAMAPLVSEPLEWTPGSQVGYSISGYLTLGLLDEQLSGKSYADLVQSQIFGPAGMTNSKLDDTPTAGWTGFSAGGVVSTLTDQLAWGNALHRKGRILDKDSLAQVLNIDNQFNTGLGAFPACPCSLDNGVKVYSSIGHKGGQATVQYAPNRTSSLPRTSPNRCGRTI